jgi:hypothetical protein
MARLGQWLVALREHSSGRLDHAQYRALVSLALRLDWKSGKGFASIAEVAADADCGPATVKRAITWARGRGLLERTARGHSVGRGSSARASEYLTSIPSQGITGEPLRAVSRDHGDGFKGSRMPFQGITREPPSKSSTSKSSTSSVGARATGLLREVDATVTDEESAEVLNILRGQGARDPVAVLRSMGHADRRYYLGLARHNIGRAQWRREEPRVKQDDPAQFDPAALLAATRKRHGWLERPKDGRERA